MSRAEQFYGANDINRMFPDGAPTTVVPWDRAGRRKDREDYDRGALHAELSKPVDERALHDVDPRYLHAYQPGITRGGVQHYLTDEYHLSGRTFADHEMVGNQHPVIYRRAGLDGAATQNMILSGHHRAAVALLRGDPLRARVVEGGWGPERGGPAQLEREVPKIRGMRSA